MIHDFGDRGTRDVFDGRDTASARRTCPVTPWPAARRKLALLHFAEVLSDLRAVPGNRLEKLRGDCTGQHSIRINARYRVVFRWDSDGCHAVEIVDYH